MYKRTIFLISVAMLATACSNAEAEKKSQVSVDGGAVGYPLHQAVAEEYHKVN